MKHLTIAKQLAIGFGVLLVFLIGAIVFSSYQQNQLASLTEKQFKHPFTVSNAIARADGNIARVRRAVGEILLLNDAADIQKKQDEIAELDKKIQQDLDLAKAQFLGDKTDFDSLKTQYQEWMPINQRVIAAKRTGNAAEATQLLFTEAAAKLATLSTLRQKTYTFAMNKAQDFQTNAARVRDSALQLTVVLGLFSVVVGIGLAISITRSLTRPISQAVAIARTVAAGDLSQEFEVEGHNETAQLLNALKDMQHNLASVVDNVRQSSESVATASAQIAQGNNDLSSRTEEQASALQQTAASMEQLSATVKQNADNAIQGNRLAIQASDTAVHGGEVVAQVVETMKHINDSSKRIFDIISVIDSIAFQTNILALNAAVEAARAGEQGRGFAVVATEVRSLAGRSAAAAKEIKTLIGESVERVEQGSKLVDQAGVTMGDVVSSIRRVTDIMGEISAASREQSQGVSQVGEVVTQMDQATQQNAALVEESAAAADSLKSQAQQLVQTVAVFTLNPRAAANDSLPHQPATRAPHPQQDFKGVERRSPKRPNNIARLKIERNTPASAAPAVSGNKTGTDDWEQF